MDKALDTIANRLRKALSIRNVKQQELVEKADIPKSSISQYLSGYAEPKTDRVYAMAKVLDVDPVWLMGFDVPMEKKPIEETYNKKKAEVVIELNRNPALSHMMDLYLTLDEDERNAINTIMSGMAAKKEAANKVNLPYRVKKESGKTTFEFQEPHDEHPEQ